MVHLFTWLCSYVYNDCMAYPVNCLSSSHVFVLIASFVWKQGVSSRRPTYSVLQSSALITRSTLSSYYTQHCNFICRTYQLEAHNRHPIPWPKGRVLGRVLWRYWKNIDRVLRITHCICTFIFFNVTQGLHRNICHWYWLLYQVSTSVASYTFDTSQFYWKTHLCTRRSTKMLILKWILYYSKLY